MAHNCRVSSRSEYLGAVDPRSLTPIVLRKFRKLSSCESAAFYRTVGVWWNFGKAWRRNVIQGWNTEVVKGKVLGVRVFFWPKNFMRDGQNISSQSWKLLVRKCLNPRSCGAVCPVPLIPYRSFFLYPQRSLYVLSALCVLQRFSTHGHKLRLTHTHTHTHISVS